MAPSPSKRTWIIEQEFDPETGAQSGTYDRAQAIEMLQDLEAVLATVGGVLHIATDRVKVGDVGDEPVYDSRRLIIQWRAFAPGREEQRAPEPELEPEPVEA